MATQHARWLGSSFRRTNPLVNDANNPSAAGDGLTNIFRNTRAGTDPTNKDRTIPVVNTISSVTNSGGTYINSAVVLVFNHAMLNPIQIAALQAILAKDTNVNVWRSLQAEARQSSVRRPSPPTVPRSPFQPSQNLAISTTLMAGDGERFPYADWYSDGRGLLRHFHHQLDCGSDSSRDYSRQPV